MVTRFTAGDFYAIAVQMTLGSITYGVHSAFIMVRLRIPAVARAIQHH